MLDVFQFCSGMTDHMTLTAPRRFAITIVGDTQAVWNRHNLTKTALPHHLSRLLLGQPVSLPELEAFGLRIHVEWDPDDWPKSGPAESAASGAKR